MKPATIAHNKNKQTSEEHDCCNCAQEAETNCCNKETQVYSRVVGYIRPIDNWNVAKKEEFEQRKTYKIKKDE